MWTEKADQDLIKGTTESSHSQAGRQEGVAGRIAPGRVLGRLWGGSWGHLEASLGRLGNVLDSPMQKASLLPFAWVCLGVSWKCLRAVSRAVGGLGWPWGHFGSVLETLTQKLGLLRFAQVWLGACWKHPSAV